MSFAKTSTVELESSEIESEIAQLDADDQATFLADLGLDEPGLAKLARAAYALLGLETFFTAGPKEIRAWTMKSGIRAPQAAGVIHTDFERGFIRAEVYRIDDLERYGSEAAMRAGKHVLVEKPLTGKISEAEGIHKQMRRNLARQIIIRIGAALRQP